MKFVYGILIALLPMVSIAQDTLIYIGDPLCSWCYGFAPEISDLKEELSGQYEFKLVMGGLRPYNTETMADLGDFLKEHWESVSKRSGQAFSYGILEDKSFVYDTEPPARAVWVVRELKPDSEFAFFKDVQVLFYQENKNTNEVENYRTIVEKHGMSFSDFESLFNSTDARLGVKADFEFSQQMGVRGFPSVVLKQGEEWFLIANGYNTAENLLKTVQKIQKESK